MKNKQHLDLSNYLPYLVNRLGAALVEWFSENALGDRNLSIAMWRVFAVLENENSQRLTDLSHRTSIEISTLSRLVTRLEAMALVQRKRKASNNREVVIELNSRGLAMASAMIPVALELEHAAVSGVSKKDLAAVKRVLRTMHENLTRPHDVKRAGEPRGDRRETRAMRR